MTYDYPVYVTYEKPRFVATLRYPLYDVRWTRETLDAAVGAAVFHVQEADCDARVVLHVAGDARIAAIR